MLQNNYVYDKLLFRTNGLFKWSDSMANYTEEQRKAKKEELMEKCFCEYYRVLKPNRWMTVEFHNSKNSDIILQAKVTF